MGVLSPESSAPGTPMTSTPAGSGDEVGPDGEMKFKAAKGKKKLTRKEMKAREDRRRARTRESKLYFLFLTMRMMKS